MEACGQFHALRPWLLIKMRLEMSHNQFWWIHSFLSFGTCRTRQFLAVLRSFHSSLLCTFSCHSSPPTIHPSSLTSYYHLFLGPPLSLVVPKFIHNILLGILQADQKASVQLTIRIPTQLMILRWPSQNTLGIWTVLYWTRSSRTQFGVSINVRRLAGVHFEHYL